MLDFLSFDTLISQNILIFFYYIGAVFMPLFFYMMRGYYLKKFSFIKNFDAGLKELYHSLAPKHKLILSLGFFILFIMMELCWRMIFEMMIAYFEMHEYLYEMKNNL